MSCDDDGWMEVNVNGESLEATGEYRSLEVSDRSLGKTVLLRVITVQVGRTVSLDVWKRGKNRSGHPRHG